MALAGLAALTSLGALFFWRGACVTFARRLTLFLPGAGRRDRLRGLNFCSALTGVHTSHYAAFHLENILRSRLARKHCSFRLACYSKWAAGQWRNDAG